MVIFENRETAVVADKEITALKQRLGVRREFKFNKCNDQIRDAFIRKCCEFEFTCRVIGVQKLAIDNELLQGVTEPYHKFFVKEIIAHEHHLLADARVFIDGEGGDKQRGK